MKTCKFKAYKGNTEFEACLGVLVRPCLNTRSLEMGCSKGGHGGSVVKPLSSM